jgi:hypothetical protein
MKRLRDSEPKSPLIEQAHAMIDAVPPLPESRERMLRVRRELDRPRGLLAGVRRAPALAFAALVALFGASAFAAVRYIAARPERAPAGQAQAGSAAFKRAHGGAKHGAQAPAPQPTSVPVAPSPRPATAAPAEALPIEPAAASAHGGAGSSARSAAHVAAPRVEPRARAGEPDRAHAADGEHARPTSDSELVHSAVKALRRDGDPALAARLLDENRKRYPDGPLAEEALSLQIEAALALHDPRARAFAREYVARYPSGRYLSIAQRALEGATP